MEAQEVEQVVEGGEQVVETPSEPQPASEVVERAKLMGWVPKEEFKGDESRWRPADEFVSRADELMPIMKSQLRKYETELTGLKGTIDEQKKTMEKLVKMGDTVGQQAYERAKRELKTSQMEAVATGDIAAWERLEGEREKLIKPDPIAVPSSDIPGTENPDFKSWHQGNDWYLKDEDLTLFANTYGQKLAAEMPKLSYSQWLVNVEDKVKKAFPHKFTNPRRAQASPVDSSASRSSASLTRAKNYNDLPADAKKQCDKYLEQKLFKTRDDYVKIYFEEA